MLVLGALPWDPAYAQSRQISILRDAEIEDTIRVYADPLFVAAGLDPQSINIHLVNDRSLNAFVSNGRNMFMFSGLLMSTDDPNQIIGVIAHETGHIAGGHLVSVRGEVEKATAAAILSTILGIAVAAATGEGAAAAAGSTIGSGIAQREFFRYTRTQESAADQAALSYLDATGQSSEGLYDLLRTFENQELLSATNQDPYMRTHPLTSDRLQAVKHHIEVSPHSNAPADPDLMMRQARMVAKLVGFLESLRVTLQRYPESDQSIPARYARSIAYFQDRQMDKAVPLIDGLIAEEPDNPYFHELKGQMLFETGSGDLALASYAQSVELAPDQPLLAIGYAQALIESGEETNLEIAASSLEQALRIEPRNATAWRLLGMAYGRLGLEARASVASAEFSYLTGDHQQAEFLARRAVQGLEYGTPDWQRANDILNALNAGDG
ncbi:MAG: M48 family metalloprotease [Pseudomonadota bacterium]